MNRPDVERIFEMLLERFGEPIHDQPAMVGARDEGPGGKALWNDDPKLDREWSDPDVVKEMDAVGAEIGVTPKKIALRKANRIVARYADADMGVQEIFSLLVHNNIPRDIARAVAQDVRGEALGEAAEKDKEEDDDEEGKIVGINPFGNRPIKEETMDGTIEGTTCEDCGSMISQCSCGGGMMPESLDEIGGPDDFNNFDRTGSENMPRKTTTREAIADVVNGWYKKHGGKIDRPDTGNKTRPNEIVDLLAQYMLGEPDAEGGTNDAVGSMWQIEDLLKSDYLHWDELAQELYGLIGTNESVELDEVTPPGREKQVKALKKDKNVDNPWAVAWSSYDKSHKNESIREAIATDEAERIADELNTMLASDMGATFPGFGQRLAKALRADFQTAGRYPTKDEYELLVMPEDDAGDEVARLFPRTWTEIGTNF